MSARTAVGRARAGAASWRAAVLVQRTASAAHEDFAGLACELVETLRALQALCDVLSRQVADYGRGRAVYDDAGPDPRQRLADAAAWLSLAGRDLADAQRSANWAWSAIGHIGVDISGGRS